MEPTETDRDFPKSAGILIGLGLGGFFDGIVLHQLLQWRHMLTSFGYPADNVRNLEINIVGRYFHSSTYFLIWGALMLAGGWFLLKGGEQETPDERAIHLQVKLNR